MNVEQKKDQINFGWIDLFRAHWFFLEGHRRSYVLWTSGLVTNYFYAMFPPLIISRVIDFLSHYKAGQSLNEFYMWAAVLGFGTGINALIRLTSKNKLADIVSHARYAARTKGFERLIDFSVVWHDKENTGNKVQRIQAGNAAMGNLQQLVQTDLFIVSTTYIGVFIAFIFLNPVFLVFMILYLVGFFFIQSKFYKKLVALQEESNKSNEQASGSFYEGVSNVLTIKTLGAQQTFKSSIIEREKRARDMTIRTRKIGFMKWKVFQVFNAACSTLYLLLVGHNVLSGLISIGLIYTYAAYLDKLVESAAVTTDIIDSLVEYRSAISRMMPIFWQNEVSTHGKNDFPNDWKSIQISDGSFVYHAELPEVSRKPDDLFSLHLNKLVINRNARIGIVGHSGSGKSTLAKILLGLYKLESGTFTVDGLPYESIRHDEITRMVTIVLQDSEMFNLSLKDNITLMKEVSPELFEKAVRISQLEGIIAKLPQGLDTLIGEKGYRLSGGERQRVGIARAICKDSPLIVFDEATSSLDSKTEQRIQEGIEKELGKKTLVTIAHRLSTLKQAQNIYVFDHGEIIETGKFAELLADPKSKFAALYKLQQSSLAHKT